MRRTIVLYLVLGTAALPLLLLLSTKGWMVLAQTPPAGLPVTATPEAGSELVSTPGGGPAVNAGLPSRNGAIDAFFRRLFREYPLPWRPELPYKILVINWNDPSNPQAGGAEVNLSQIFGRIAAAGHEVWLLACGYPGSEREAEMDGIRVIRRGRRCLTGWRVWLVIRIR